MDKVLFWDFDGTLVYSDKLWSRCLTQALEAGAPGTGVGFEDILRYMDHQGLPWHDAENHHPELMVPEAWWANARRVFTGVYTQCGLEEGLARRLSEGVRARILDPANYTLYDDAVDTLQACRQRGWRCVILSNNFPELPHVVQALGLADFFEGIVVSALVGYEKPHPAIFDHALTLAGRPRRCFLIGDNPRSDGWGGSRVGIPVMLVHGRRCAEAAHHCASLRDILPLLEGAGA